MKSRGRVAELATSEYSVVDEEPTAASTYSVCRHMNSHGVTQLQDPALLVETSTDAPGNNYAHVTSSAVAHSDDYATLDPQLRTAFDASAPIYKLPLKAANPPDTAPQSEYSHVGPTPDAAAANTYSTLDHPNNSGDHYEHIESQPPGASTYSTPNQSGARYGGATLQRPGNTYDDPDMDGAASAGEHAYDDLGPDGVAAAFGDQYEAVDGEF